MSDERGKDYVGTPPPSADAPSGTGERRVALVIGNGAYRHTTRLPNPVVAGTLIAYTTQPGHVAYDGDGEHGFFTEALLSHIDRPDLNVELMLRDVRGHVLGPPR